jgi:hypothetical protein
MRKKSWFTGAIAGLTVLGMAGCSTNGTTQDAIQKGQDAGKGAEAEQPYKISMMFNYDIAPPKNDSEVVKNH